VDEAVNGYEKKALPQDWLLIGEIEAAGRSSAGGKILDGRVMKVVIEVVNCDSGDDGQFVCCSCTLL